MADSNSTKRPVSCGNCGSSGFHGFYVVQDFLRVSSLLLGYVKAAMIIFLSMLTPQRLIVNNLMVESLGLS